MRRSSSESVSVLIQCPHCGEAFEKRLAGLLVKNTAACSRCGGVVNLKNGDTGAMIQKLAQACAAADAARSKRIKLVPRPSGC